VIRPVKGRDVEFEENVRSGLDHGYPGPVQTLFVFDDEAEPGVPAVRGAIEAHREAGRRGEVELLFCGPPPPGRTGKLHAMIHGLRHAKGDLVAFADSDIRTDRDALRVLVETLHAAPRAGAAFAPVIVSEPNRTLFDAVCAMLLNGLYTPYASRQLRQHDGELPFILGQLMVLTREALTAIGGLETVSGQLVDDLYIGQLVRQAGLRNVASTHPIRIIQYGLSPGEGLHRYLRWLTFSRVGIPQWSFKLPIVWRASVLLTGLAMGIWAVAVGHLLVAAAGFALAAGVTGSINRLHDRTGCAPLRARHALASWVIVFLAPLVFARIYLLQRSIPWRGRVYDLRAGRLAAADAAPPADAGGTAAPFRDASGR
jgi:ceramide glucosyltransferase